MKKCINCPKELVRTWYTFDYADNRINGEPNGYCRKCVIKVRDKFQGKVCCEHIYSVDYYTIETHFCCPFCFSEEVHNITVAEYEEHRKSCRKSIDHLIKDKSDTAEREKVISGFSWKSPYLIGGGVALLLGIGLIIYFLTRKKPKEDDESWK